jgi:hypothetical protein
MVQIAFFEFDSFSRASQLPFKGFVIFFKPLLHIIIIILGIAIFRVNNYFFAYKPIHILRVLFDSAV